MVALGGLPSSSCSTISQQPLLAPLEVSQLKTNWLLPKRKVLPPAAPPVGDQRTMVLAPAGAGPLQAVFCTALSETALERLPTVAPLASLSCHLMGRTLPQVCGGEMDGLARVPAVASGERKPVKA